MRYYNQIGINLYTRMGNIFVKQLFTTKENPNPISINRSQLRQNVLLCMVGRITIVAEGRGPNLQVFLI